MNRKILGLFFLVLNAPAMADRLCCQGFTRLDDPCTVDPGFYPFQFCREYENYQNVLLQFRTTKYDGSDLVYAIRLNRLENQHRMSIQGDFIDVFGVPQTQSIVGEWNQQELKLELWDNVVTQISELSCQLTLSR